MTLCSNQLAERNSCAWGAWICVNDNNQTNICQFWFDCPERILSAICVSLSGLFGKQKSSLDQEIAWNQARKLLILATYNNSLPPLIQCTTAPGNNYGTVMAWWMGIAAVGENIWISAPCKQRATSISTSWRKQVWTRSRGSWGYPRTRPTGCRSGCWWRWPRQT